MHARADEIVQAAHSLIDCRYRHQGRDKETGLDCVGVPIWVAKHLGISTFDTQGYGRRPDAKKFREELLSTGCRRVLEPEHGDLVVMLAPRHPVHTGIFEVDARGKSWVIHAWAPARKVVRQRLTDNLDILIVESMRFPE